MIGSAVIVRLRTRCGSGLRTLAFAFCGLLLLAFVAPHAHAAFVDASTQSAATAQKSLTPAQAKYRAERREEIQQRKIDNPEAQDASNIYRHSTAVHKLARVFGLSVETTSRLLEILNFLVLLALIIWFLARVLPKALRARTARIQSQLQQARTVTEDATRRLASVEERLARFDAEIGAIKTQAQQEALEKEKQMRAALEQQKQLILESSAQEIATASSKAQSQLKRLTAELAIERAKHRIAVTTETDRALVESFLGDLDKERRSGGVN